MHRIASSFSSYHQEVMKKQRLCLIVLASSLSYCRSLPFRTRGGKGTNEDGQLMDAIIEGNEVVQMQPSPGTPRRLEFVENFFAGTLDSSDLEHEIKGRAKNMTNFLVQTRRTLHRHPELMYQEEQTSQVIQTILSDLGVSFTTGWAINAHPRDVPGKGGYGIVADIGTGKPPCVLLRADIDALPIKERTEGIDEFKSRNDGTMHACGHDGHTTMLLGATAMLMEMEDSINGTIRVIFQPAEEGGAGAKRMREEGILDMEPKPQYAFG
jgi:hypothetical protein